MMRLDHPPTPTGDINKDIWQMFSYLYQMAETLNVTLEELQDERKEDK